MNGILKFTDDTLVGKKSQFKTKEEFLQECVTEYELDSSKADINKVDDGYVRFYPRGTQDSAGEFGEGEPVYQFVDKGGRGVIHVWVFNEEWEAIDG